MKTLGFIFFCWILTPTLWAQTTTNSAGTGTFTNTGTWTSPQNLTGTATIMDGHTVTIPNNINQVYSTKINFSGTGKLVLAGSASKWVPATNMNATPTMESFNLETNWSASSVWNAPIAFGGTLFTPWIDASQCWSAGSGVNQTDYLQYDLKSPRWIQGIVSQGRVDWPQWVTTAKVQVSIDNVNWSTASESLTMNTDQNTKVSNNFPNVMYGRYVRVTPMTVYGHPSMRLGILLRDNIFKSCNEIKTNFPQASSGVYVIDPDGSAGATPSTSCYCDMATDGGGWTLVLNYLHRGGTAPAVKTFSNSLPLLGSTVLGTDESASTTTWGNTTASYLNKFTFSELRFYGATNAHSRIIHFKTTHSGTISYFKTGYGSMNGIATNFTALASHSAYLPASAANFFTDQLDNAMTNFPFWLNGTYHWGIRGNNTRWEVDDYNGGNGYHTYHQIWIR